MRKKEVLVVSILLVLLVSSFLTLTWKPAYAILDISPIKVIGEFFTNIYDQVSDYLTGQNNPTILGDIGSSCSTDSDCNGACLRCSYGTCQAIPLSEYHICREAVPGGCDSAEYCQGSSDCPPDVSYTGTLCRAASGECDKAEYCTKDHLCQSNAFQPDGYPCSYNSGYYYYGNTGSCQQGACTSTPSNCQWDSCSSIGMEMNPVDCSCHCPSGMSQTYYSTCTCDFPKTNYIFGVGCECPGDQVYDSYLNICKDQSTEECPAGKTYNSYTRACDCSSQCTYNQIQDQDSCECSCPSPCNPNEVQDLITCQCSAQTCSNTCPSDATQNPDCSCSCQSSKSYNSQTNTCECPAAPEGYAIADSTTCEYEIVENPTCGDGTCNNDETCSSCQSDCGFCQEGDGCTETCSTKGFECGSQTICSRTVNCGICDSGKECVSGKCETKIESSSVLCGNSNLDSDEECDDGNTVDGDGCSSGCLKEFCNDGIVNNGEECEQLHWTPVPEAGKGCLTNYECDEYPSGYCFIPAYSNNQICTLDSAHSYLYPNSQSFLEIKSKIESARKHCTTDKDCSFREKCISLGQCKYSRVSCTLKEKPLAPGLECKNIDGDSCSSDCKSEIKCGDEIVNGNDECDRPVCIPNQDIACKLDKDCPFSGKCKFPNKYCDQKYNGKKIKCNQDNDCRIFGGRVAVELGKCRDDGNGICDYSKINPNGYYSCNSDTDCFPYPAECKNIDEDLFFDKCTSECKKPGSSINIFIDLFLSEQYKKETEKDRHFTPLDITPFDDIVCQVSISSSVELEGELHGELYTINEYGDLSLKTGTLSLISPDSIEDRFKREEVKLYSWKINGWSDGWITDDQLIKEVIKSKKILCRVRINNTVYSTEKPVETCVHLWGVDDSKFKFAYKAGTSANGLTLKWSGDTLENIRTLMPSNQLVKTAISNYESGFNQIDPFKTYKLAFSHYADLEVQDDTSWPMKHFIGFTYYWGNEGRIDRKCEATHYFFYEDRTTTSHSWPISSVMWLSSFGSPIISVHEAAHGFCGLFDEYTYSPLGFFAELGVGRNCRPCLFNSFSPYGKNNAGCTFGTLCRSSETSIMEIYPTIPRFNTIGCGYCLNQIIGGKIEDNFKECSTMDTIYPGECEQDYDCRSDDSNCGICKNGKCESVEECAVKPPGFWNLKSGVCQKDPKNKYYCKVNPDWECSSALTCATNFRCESHKCVPED